MTPPWPRVVAALLKRRVPSTRQEEVLGDLAEDFADRRRAHGRLPSWLWLIREVRSLRRSYPRQIEADAADRPALPAREMLMQDLRLGARILRKNPGFSLIAVLTLALSIGANTTIFSVIEGALLRPLPYADSDQLVSITNDNLEKTFQGFNVSLTKLQRIRERSHTLVTAGAYLPTSTSLTTDGTPEQVAAARATIALFETLGVAPALGRGFLPSEDQTGGADVAIITDGFWHSHFAADPHILGRAIRLDGKTTTIVGVLPATFRFPFQQPAPEVWFPRVFDNPALGLERIRSGAAYLVVYGRLRFGASVAQAQVELDAINESYHRDFPGFADAPFVLDVISLKESLVGPLRASLFVLLAAVGLVLLIGCSNIASMLLARATIREKEIALRRALGASRSRLIRQLLTESLLLSFLGGTLGVALAAGLLRLLPSLPPGLLPRVEDIRLDGGVLGFSVALAVLAGLLFGLAPSLRVSHTNIQDTLKQSGRGSSEGRASGRARAVLVVAEVAFAVVLVTCAGLLVKSFSKLTHVDAGFDARNAMTFSLSLPSVRYPQPAQQAEFYRRFVEAVQAIPGIRSAGVSSFLPLGGLRFVYVCPEGTVCLGIGKDPVIALRQITPDYFKALGMPLLRGRPFDDHDIAGAHPVAIVNQTTAAHYFPTQDALGKHLLQSRGNIETEIVGITRDVRSRGLNSPYVEELFVPQAQSPAASMTLTVRSASAPEPLIAAVRRVVSRLDPDLPLTNVSSMVDVVSAAVAQPRLTAQLTASFAMLALLLATLGIYGILAYSVTQRTHEIGMRIALGALGGDVVRLVLRQGLGLVLVGIAVGSAASLAVTQLLATLLVGTSSRDPATFFGVAIVLIVAALAASYFPARRAARLDPIVALRRP